MAKHVNKRTPKLRFAHNTAELRCRRVLEKFPEVVAKLFESLHRFLEALRCVDKPILSEVAGVPWDQVQYRSTKTIAELRASPDGQEGLKAFLEKRPPNWISKT